MVEQMGRYMAYWLDAWMSGWLDTVYLQEILNNKLCF